MTETTDPQPDRSMRVVLTVTVNTRPDGDYYVDEADLTRHVIPWIEGGLYDRDDLTEVTVTPAAVLPAPADRYRTAWLSARGRAQDYGEGILRHVADRDWWKRQAHAVQARAVPADRAAIYREVAEELAGINFHPNAKSQNLELCRLLAGRFNRKADEVERMADEAQADDRATIIAELLPVWEAMYEPGSVSDYLIGYANSEAAAKGAAEAWMRSQAEVTGRLEWVPQRPLDGYDAETELVERHDDGIDTGPGITVRRRVEPAAVSQPSKEA